MKLNLSQLPNFGNMTFGSGLASMFDNNNATGAWAQTTTGWAGVDFGESPQVVDYVIATSASNGFDASGAASQVRLSLWGKNGSAPTSHNDGVMLGSFGYFTDPNASVEQTIHADGNQAYRYVWVVVETGVWAVLLGIEIHAREVASAPPPPPPPPPSYITLTSERTVIGRSINTPVLLTPAFAELEGFRTVIEMQDEAGALVDVRADVVHRGEFTGYQGVLSIGMVVGFRYAATLADLPSATVQRVPNAVVGCNLMNRNPHHYEKLHACSSLEMQPGFYEFTVLMNAATDAPGYTSADGLAALLQEGGLGLNRMRIVIDKSMAVFEV